MSDRHVLIRDKLFEISEWSGTTIFAWAIFDENGLAFFLDNIGWDQSENLEMALGAIVSKIGELVKDSSHYGLAFNLGTFELKNRHKLHYFRLGEMSLVVITEYKVRGEEQFLKNMSLSLEEFQGVL
ncbi:MAG: hypothetical protein ACXACI_03340 [Candidatus Hodarchaeales archaeon]|jgi:hypothetical protein